MQRHLKLQKKTKGTARVNIQQILAILVSSKALNPLTRTVLCFTGFPETWLAEKVKPNEKLIGRNAFSDITYYYPLKKFLVVFENTENRRKHNNNRKDKPSENFDKSSLF